MQSLPPDLPGRTAMDILQQFVTLFENKGWLDQTLRIRHRDGRYRISCSQRGFFAYRINDQGGLPPGFPGWPVCIITSDQIIDDSKRPAFASTEPSVYEWLRCFATGEFELI